MNPLDYGAMIKQLMMRAQPVMGDVVKGPPNWFNQGLPVKGMDPLGESMGRQGMAGAGLPSKWFGGWKPPGGSSARDSAQTSFPPGAVPPPAAPKPTPILDGMVGKLRNAAGTMGRMDTRSSLRQEAQGALNQYSAWAHKFGVEPSKIQGIIKQAHELGMGQQQFMFMLAKLRQEGEL